MATTAAPEIIVDGKVDSDSPFYDLVQIAYRVFKQAPTEHGVCECCMYRKIRNDFFNHGQANLPLHYVQDWFFAAADIPLNKSAWRFVLPRILEILASGQEPSNIGIEVSLSRFDTGNASNWSKEEWAVLDAFQKLFLSESQQRIDDRLDDAVCMFASAGWSSDDLFSQVLEWPAENLVAKLWEDWCNYPNPNIWITAFWNSEQEPRAFYTSQALQEKITNFALCENTASNLSKKAIEVSDLITRYASN